LGECQSSVIGIATFPDVFDYWIMITGLLKKNNFIEIAHTKSNF